MRSLAPRPLVSSSCSEWVCDPLLMGAQTHDRVAARQVGRCLRSRTRTKVLQDGVAIDDALCWTCDTLGVPLPACGSG